MPCHYYPERSAYLCLPVCDVSVCLCTFVDMGLARISFGKNNSRAFALLREKKTRHQLIRCVATGDVACMQFTYRTDKSCCFLSTEIQISIWMVRRTLSLRLSYQLESTLHAKCVCDSVFVGVPLGPRARSIHYPIEAIFAEFVTEKPTSSAHHRRQCRLIMLDFDMCRIRCRLGRRRCRGRRKKMDIIFLRIEHFSHSPVTSPSSTCHLRWEIFLYSPSIESKRNGKCLRTMLDRRDVGMKPPAPGPVLASKKDYEFLVGTCLLFG